MPVKDIVVGLCGILTVLVVALGGWLFGSEYYLFIPDVRFRRRRGGPTVPPTSFGFVVFLIIAGMVIFLLSRRIAAIYFTVLPFLAILGIPLGILLYEWTPGWAHYLLTAALCGLALLLWSNDNFHDD